MAVEHPVAGRRRHEAEHLGAQRCDEIGVGQELLARRNALGAPRLDPIVEPVQVHRVLEPHRVDDAEPHRITLRKRKHFGVREALAVHHHRRFERLTAVGIIQEPLTHDEDVIVGAASGWIDDDRAVQLRVEPEPVDRGGALECAPVEVRSRAVEPVLYLARGADRELHGIGHGIAPRAQTSDHQRGITAVAEREPHRGSLEDADQWAGDRRRLPGFDEREDRHLRIGVSSGLPSCRDNVDRQREHPSPLRTGRGAVGVRDRLDRVGRWPRQWESRERRGELGLQDDAEHGERSDQKHEGLVGIEGRRLRSSQGRSATITIESS